MSGNKKSQTTQDFIRVRQCNPSKVDLIWQQKTDVIHLMYVYIGLYSGRNFKKSTDFNARRYVAL